MLKLILLISSLVLISSCQALDLELKQMDQDPPIDYDPTFITSISNIDIVPPKDPKLIISRVDPYSSDKVRLFVHLVNGDTTFLSGADKGKWKDIWCDVIEVNKGLETKITKFQVVEGDKDDRPPMAISIVMDHSGSMGEDRALIVQEAVKNMIVKKDDKDKLSLIKYDSKIATEVNLSGDKIELLSNFGISGLQGFGGLTATANGMMRGLDELNSASPNDLKTVLVFTDGVDNSSTFTKDEILQRAKAENAIICAFDYGYNVTENFLSDLANKTNGFYQHIYLTDELNYVFDDIYNRFNHFYMVDIELPEYGLHTIKMRVCLEDTGLVQEITFDNTPQVGQINLLKVYFDFNKDNIKPESEESIVKVAKLMSAIPSITIELRGHTDNKNSTGDPDYNKKLSQKRADAVKSSLVKKGISADRIKSIGYGESVPVADNNTEEGRANNRRTEFVITNR